MRRPTVALTLLAATLVCGCLTNRRPPYANDPLLLHYKPTLSDSATILAEKQIRRGPTRPPMPPAGRDTESLASPDAKPKDEAIQPVRGQKPAPPVLPPPAKPETTLLPPPPAAPDSAPLPSPPKKKDFATVTMPDAVVLPEIEEPIATAGPPAKEPASEPQPVQLAAAPPAGPAAVPGKPHRTADGDFGHDADYRWIQGKLERHHRGYFCVRYRDPSEEDTHGGKVRLQDDPRVTAFDEGDVVGVEGGVEQATGEREPYPRFIVRDLWLVRKR